MFIYTTLIIELSSHNDANTITEKRYKYTLSHVTYVYTFKGIFSMEKGEIGD